MPESVAAMPYGDTPGHLSMSPKRAKIWLLLAVALFLLQVLPFLSYRWVTDESWYAGPGVTLSQSHGLSGPGIGPNDPEHTLDVRPPGTAIVMAGSFRVLGTNVVAARMGSVLAGGAIVILLFLLTRDLFGETGAVMCALLAATDNFLVTTSRTARPEALTTLCIVLGMLALKQYWRRGGTVWALLCGLVMALGTMFHVTLLGFIVSYGLLLIVLDYREKRFFLRGVLLYSAGYLAGLVPYAMWVLGMANGEGRRDFRLEFISRAKGDSFLTKFLQELHRYADYFGVGMLHSHSLHALPVRLPIPLVFFLATFLLWHFRRNWFYLELLLLVPTMLWLIDTANKSSRYLAILSPITVLVLGGAAAVLHGRGHLQRWAIVVAGCVIVAQFGANLILLNGARKADYSRVTAELQSVIPPGSAAYGTITFWFGMRDHPYISDERTDPLQAAQEYGSKYFISGDRMMTEGSSTDGDFYTDLRLHMTQVAATGTLVGEFDDPYYGDLKVYRIR
ncbi:MAG: ArnT family glycosyltransferase [Janthinobacterium lividum]